MDMVIFFKLYFILLTCRLSMSLTVDRSNEGLVSVPSSISTSATELYLNNNAISQLADSAFSTLTMLVKLDLSSNMIDTISSLAFTGTSIEILILTNNNIMGSIPDLSSLKHSLKYLDLKTNYIDNIDGLQGLIHLSTLILEDNFLSEDPNTSYFTNTSITHLDLSATSLTSIPNLDGISETLSHLELDRNFLDVIPISKLVGLTALTTLHLEGNDIAQVADSAFFNTSITTLYINDNQLTEVPYLVDICNTLLTVHLENNGITKINKDHLQGCTALSIFNISNNPLIQVPNLGSLGISLSDLDVTGASFNCCEVGWMKQVTNLEVDSSPCSSPPEHVGKLWTALTENDVNGPCENIDFDCGLCIQTPNGIGLASTKLCIFKEIQSLNTIGAIEVKARSLLYCSKECTVNITCVSINYNKNTQYCTMMTQLATEQDVIYSSQSVYGVVNRNLC